MHSHAWPGFWHALPGASSYSTRTRISPHTSWDCLTLFQTQSTGHLTHIFSESNCSTLRSLSIHFRPHHASVPAGADDIHYPIPFRTRFSVLQHTESLCISHDIPHLQPAGSVGIEDRSLEVPKSLARSHDILYPFPGTSRFSVLPDRLTDSQSISNDIHYPFPARPRFSVMPDTDSQCISHDIHS